MPPADRILAVVPAWNEAAAVGALVHELVALPEAPDVLVVDDGSTDDTAAVARGAGAEVLRLCHNSGIGPAVQAGILVALREGYAIGARFDGDGQHVPGVLDRLVAPLRDGSADFVLGSRYLGDGDFRSTFARRLGARWFAALLRTTAGLRVTDPTSGCWAANRDAMRVLARGAASDYPEVDSLLDLARGGLRVHEVPVPMRARGAGRSSIGGLRIPYYMIKVTLAVLVGRRARTDPPGDRP